MALAHALQRRVKAQKDESNDEIFSDNNSPASGRSETGLINHKERTSSNDSDDESDQNRDEDQVRHWQTKSVSS